MSSDSLPTEIKKDEGVDKLRTAIPGLDLIAEGGLPQGRVTLLSGTAGSGKTVLAAQFLAAGIMHCDQAGVFITFEEPPRAIRKNMRGFGWTIEKWEAEQKWSFVDASPQPQQKPTVTGEYDMGPLLARIEYAIRTINAKRVVIDSLGSVFNRVADQILVRDELFRLALALGELEVTTIITAERAAEHGEVARFGVEEFVTDDVVILRNALEAEKRRRTVEILKFRGTSHQKGEYPFTILPDEGIVVIPLSAMELTQKSTDKRITSGVLELDSLCNGGFFQDSVILISGPTGTGKTLLVTQFLDGGFKNNERCLLFAFEESRDQLNRNATGWGVDFDAMQEAGLLKIVCRYPEATGLEDHLIRMKEVMEAYQPNRVAVDSLSALERVSTEKGFREFVISLTSFIKSQKTAGLFTATTANLLGGTSVTEAHISTITDSIILLRYVEMFGEMRRGLTVLKMRGSMHIKDIREFRIDGSGAHIGNPLRNINGILSGNFTYMNQGELDRVSQLFSEPPAS